MLKRQFLRALVREAWGLSMRARTYEETAAWLSERGYPTSLSEVKNAKRKGNDPTAGAVAAVPAVADLLRLILAEFPQAEWRNFFGTEADLAATLLAGGAEQ